MELFHLQYHTFSEKQQHGTTACGCEVPCHIPSYDATISSSLLDTYKIKEDVISSSKAAEILPKHQEALEISAQVGKSISVGLSWY